MNRTSVHSIVLVSVAALAAACGFWGARLTTGAAAGPATEPAAETEPVPVATEAVRRGELTEPASAFGVVQTRNSDALTVSVPFESVAKNVRVTVGQSVAAGDELLDVEASPEARLQLRQAEDAVTVAERNSEQARSRRDQQLATNADVNTAEQALQAAKTQLDSLKSRGVGTAQVLKSAKAGVVTAVGVQPGQVAAAGLSLVVVSPDDSIEIRIGVDPADLEAIKVGSAVSVLVPNSTNTLIGAVRQESRALNSQRLCDIFVSLNGAASLRPGTFVEATFARRTVTGLIVPRSATQQEDQDWCVYVDKDGKAVRHVVTLGASDGKDIVVAGEGLAEGDEVVVERNGELADGTAIKPEAEEEKQ